MADELQVDYRTEPSRYRHWKLAFAGSVATLSLDIAEDGGIRGGYKLKLNSYDLGVDIELHDAVQRIRFEHPEVRCVVVTSARDRIFCSGANIFMLGLSSHAWKVNFCKFTNETRNGLEDASRHSGLKFIAAVNGACAGGGYELALACDEIFLVDDRSSSVGLPEVPLLGVLPGTGGLTRVTDKRHVRHDLADIFCTLNEGVRGQKAKDWRLVDAVVKPAQFVEAVNARAHELAKGSDRPAAASGIALTPLQRMVDAAGYHYDHVDVAIDRERRTASFTVRGPAGPQPSDISGIEAAGARWWPLHDGARTRRCDPLPAHQRTRTRHLARQDRGRSAIRPGHGRPLRAFGDHWLVRETIGMLRRTLARLDVTSRTIFALIEPGSCFAGTLLELALAADRTYMASLPDDPQREPCIALTDANFGTYPMVNGQARVARRFYDESAPLLAARGTVGTLLSPADAEMLGLVTAAPDDLDWADEIRIAVEERASMSPDALTGLEANLRFGGQESMETRIFGRLSAWQNWIFIRPNAVGEKGALKVYGKGGKPQFDPTRV